MNRRQYHREMNKIISSIDKNNKPLLFLHICCAPCQSAALYFLKDYFNIIGIFSNSNIDTIEEFDKRKKEVDRLRNILSSPNKIITLQYNHNDFLFYSKGHENDNEGDERCKSCIEMRLRSSIDFISKVLNDENLREIVLGSKNKSDIPKDIYFTTSLTTSSRKDPVYINSLIEKLLIGTNIKNLPSDFKKNNGNLISIELSEKYNLYRQEYCGCEYSKN